MNQGHNHLYGRTARAQTLSGGIIFPCTKLAARCCRSVTVIGPTLVTYDRVQQMMVISRDLRVAIYRETKKWHLFGVGVSSLVRCIMFATYVY